VQRESLTIVRDDFWAPTSNKQLNFLQHVKTLLKIDGQAAIVVQTTYLFEGGAGETIRRRCSTTTTCIRAAAADRIFYAQGVRRTSCSSTASRLGDAWTGGLDL